MDSYTITIAPNDDSGASTTLVVAASGGHVRITDVHLHAAEGLSSGRIPNVDFDLLLRAVAAATPQTSRQITGSASATEPATSDVEVITPAPDGDEAPPAAETRRPQTRRRARSAAPTAAPAPVAEPRRRRGRVVATDGATAAPLTEKRRRRGRPAATDGATAAPVTEPRRRRGRPAATDGAAAATVAEPRRRRGRPATDGSTPPSLRAGWRGATASRRGAAKKATATPEGVSRVYRRAPDDLAVVLAQVGTARAVAEHYDVPRHTAQGWLRRLRAAGA